MKKILLCCLFAAALGFNLTAKATDRVTLTFSRTGTGATDFTVAVNGVEGATATVTKSSHALMGLADNTIVCPNVNGSSSPTINLEFNISGLPKDFQFNTAGLHIHAFNSSGSYQSPTDGKDRQFNVDVNVNGNNFVAYNDIDIAAGITGANQNWEKKAAEDMTATDPLTLSITITKGSQNNGCFFGLQAITLGYNDASVIPDPDPEPSTDGRPDASEAKVYAIKWQNNSSSYITEQADGSLVVGDYGISNKIFWKFIPTDKENCFYIQNTATKHYIGSCNMAQGASSKVTVSTEPQEYYVGGPVSTTGANNNCFWLSSTDCSNYNKASGSVGRGLNKDGSSSNIITYYTGTSNVGSYWSFVETGDIYEIQPFTPSAAIGESAAAYHILNLQGLAYDAKGTWETMNPSVKTQQWYFVGTSNSTGGYQIVNLASHQAINEGIPYTVTDTENFAPYHFVNGNDTLILGGIHDFTFINARSEFALANQIYKMPCGSTGDVYIQKATIGENFRYPMATYTSKGISTSNASAPANKYVFLTRDAATVVPGSEEVSVAITLNRAPGNYHVILYFDWDRDGYFETSQELNATTQEFTAAFSVPADAALGKTRARIRVTDNGLSGADDDTHGEVLDLLLNVTDESATLIAPVVKVNDSDRGEASWAEGIASATAKGNSMFLYWSEGYRIIAVTNEFEAEASAFPRTLTAFFSPKTSETTGIDDALLSTTDNEAQIICNGSEITVHAASAVKAILVFAPSGAKVAGTVNDKLSVSGIAPGMYIVKAVTANGVASAKIKL